MALVSQSGHNLNKTWGQVPSVPGLSGPDFPPVDEIMSERSSQPNPDTLDATVVQSVADATTQPPRDTTPLPQHRRKKTMSGSEKTGQKKKKVSQLGDFKLQKKLGQGGMGVVYLARQISLDRTVALKTLSKELSKRDDFVKRFIREARSMAKLDHPNVVKVYAVDSHRGVHFAAIEYIDGKSAQDWLDHLGRFSVGDAINIILAAATGLKAAHDQGMVHRDIKPDNILITKTGVSKVADFGLAKAQDEDNSMTQSGAGLGTPLYMAPEQARSAKHVDHRTDIYALGATLYHMVTGELPFNADSALELILAKENGKFTPAKVHNTEVPDRLNLMIDKMLAKDAEHRYKDCAAIIQDLASLKIANAALSFIDGAQPALPVAAQAGAVTMVASTAAAATTRAGLGATSSKLDAERRDAGKRTEKVWYVQHNDDRGKKTLSKMSTAQVLQAIKKGVVDAKSRAKLNADEDWTPVAQYTEFTEAIEKSIVKSRAREKAHSMKNLYKQIDRAERNRHRWRFLRNMKDAFIGYTGFILYLVVIAAIIAALVLYGRDMLDWAADKAGLNIGSDNGAEVESDADADGE